MNRPRWIHRRRHEVEEVREARSELSRLLRDARKEADQILVLLERADGGPRHA